jgi:hypothetical protein
MINTNAIKINEKFIPVGTRLLDSKNRVGLGDKIKTFLSKKMKIDAFELFVGEEGDVLLRPLANIPSKEAWIFENPKILKQVTKGLKEAADGKVEKITDLDEFLEKL